MVDLADQAAALGDQARGRAGRELEFGHSEYVIISNAVMETRNPLPDDVLPAVRTDVPISYSTSKPFQQLVLDATLCWRCEL